MNHSEISSFIWGTADLLRSNYKQPEYGAIILPFTVMRRLDVVLEPTKQAVLDAAARKPPESLRDTALKQASGVGFYNTSEFTMAALVSDADDLALEKCGYYGQELVLLATHLGLGTCWVAGTFDREITDATIGDGQALVAIIPIGYAQEKTPFAQRAIRTNIRRRSKKPEETVEADVPYAELPSWIRSGAEAIIAGPSAVNQEPVVLTWQDGTLTARYVVKDKPREITIVDFGIAKLDFERLCGRPGRWDWGQGSAYHPAV